MYSFLAKHEVEYIESKGDDYAKQEFVADWIMLQITAR